MCYTEFGVCWQGDALLRLELAARRHALENEDHPFRVSEAPHGHGPNRNVEPSSKSTAATIPMLTAKDQMTFAIQAPVAFGAIRANCRSKYDENDGRMVTWSSHGKAIGGGEHSKC